MRRLLQAMCDHSRVELREISYETSTLATTARDTEIVCRVCGKVLVDREAFAIMRRVVRFADTGEARIAREGDGG